MREAGELQGIDFYLSLACRGPRALKLRLCAIVQKHTNYYKFLSNKAMWGSLGAFLVLPFGDAGCDALPGVISPQKSAKCDNHLATRLTQSNHCYLAYSTLTILIFLHSLSPPLFPLNFGTACSGFVAAAVSTPADVLKTRLMNQQHGKEAQLYKGMVDCFTQSVKAEG